MIRDFMILLDASDWAFGLMIILMLVVLLSLLLIGEKKGSPK